MKRAGVLLCAAILSAMIILLAGCGNIEKEVPAEEEKELVIWQMTDPHYLAEELVEDRDSFTELMAQADGKVTHYIREITEAFICEALEEKPDAVIVSGDMTMNGARASHEAFAAQLSRLTEAGIRVLVIPGNHDLRPNGARFTANEVEAAEGTDRDAFRQIYAAFGYDDALSEDEKTLSYLYALDEQTAVLMLDVNADTRGTVPSKTLQWVENALKQCGEEGRRVLAVSHQNLFVHNPLFTFGYVMNNSDKLQELYREYGVQLNLSGHMHIQHIQEEDGITEIAGSSLAVTPNQYGRLVIMGAELSYTTASVQVAAWAARQGVSDENLLNFAEYSAAFFDRCNRGGVEESMKEYTGDDAETLWKLAEEMNRGLFSGVMPQAEEELTGQFSGLPGFFSRYLGSMLPEMGNDHTVLNMTLQ